MLLHDFSDQFTADTRALLFDLANGKAVGESIDRIDDHLGFLAARSRGAFKPGHDMRCFLLSLKKMNSRLTDL